MSKIQRYRILSPDGFPFTMEDETYTKNQVSKALKNFVNRYEKQGYYSSVKYGRIHILDIPDYCEIVPV